MCFVKIVILNLNTSRKRLFAIVSVVLSPYSERYYSFHYFAFFYLIRLDGFYTYIVIHVYTVFYGN